MKKITGLVLCIALILSLVTACSEKNNEPEYSYLTETIVVTASEDNATSAESETEENSSKTQTTSSKVSKPSSASSKDKTSSTTSKKPATENKKPHFTQNLRAGINLCCMPLTIKADPNAYIFQEKYYKIVKEAGFDHIRLPLGLSSLIVGSAPKYTLDEERLKFVDKAIKYALDAGLVIVIDNHHGSQYQNEELFVAVWKQIAERYKNYPKELFFELVNEPNGGSDEECNRVQIAAYREIRKTNPTRVVVLAPNQWNGSWKLWDCEVPKIKDKNGNMVFDENIILSVHSYSPMNFTHQGITWGDTEDNIHWSDSFESAFTSELEICADYEKRTGRTVWISEWGASANAHDPNCAESCVSKYYKKFTAACAKYDIAYAVWEFNGFFRIYDIDKEEFTFRYKNMILKW